MLGNYLSLKNEQKESNIYPAFLIWTIPPQGNQIADEGKFSFREVQRKVYEEEIIAKNIAIKCRHFIQPLIN